MLEFLLSSFTDAQLCKLKKQLTSIRKNYQNPKKKEIKVFYREIGDLIYVPRFWAIKYIETYRLNKEWLRPIQGDYHISGSLQQTTERPQISVFNKTIDQLQTLGGASVILPPGTGKTNIAIAIALALKQKTLIICFNNFLIEQWRSRLQSFIQEDVNIGMIQQDTCVTENCFFVLCSIQSLVSREYDSVHKQYGLVIIDESHHIAATTFSSCLEKLQYFYSLSLTATPKRGDGLENMVYFLAGFPSYIHEAPPNSTVQVNSVVYNNGMQQEIKMNSGNLNLSRMITVLTKDKNRNKLLLDVIKILLQKYPTRKGLLLSDRVDHLRYLYSHLAPTDVAIITGSVNTEEKGKKKKRSEPVFEKFLTLSTYSMFSEAVDFDGDFLILSTPKTKVEQAVGRILRGKSLGHQPVVFDIVDPFSIFEHQRWARHRFYSKRGYQLCSLQDTDIFQEANKNP
jgi:superfamily II DNA or RNA helicase